MTKASDFLIALDDGHGIGTPGKRTPYIESLGRQIRENEFNAAVTDFLQGELERCGFRTLLTAPTDYDTPLSARTNLANAKGADALVSNHFNALKDYFDGSGKDPEGMSIHIYPGAKNGRKLAEHVAKYLKQGTEQKYRGIVEQNLHMTREFKKASILVENGFMDNEREALLMVNEAFQRECAREQAQGICEYFGVPYVPAGGKAPVKVVKPPKSDVKSETSSKSPSGQRVESIYKGSEGLNFYSRASFDTKYKAGTLAYGYGFPTTVRKLKVEGAEMFEVKNSKGDTYYITASPKYVKLEGKGEVKKPAPAKTSSKVKGRIKIVGVKKQPSSRTVRTVKRPRTLEQQQRALILK
ncbi:N-acetylmuramoyl-L-alanine amidase family protein [Rossellomorea sp. H39__3]